MIYDIIFVKCRDTSSAVTCGDEVSDLLNTSGLNCKSVHIRKFKLESTKSYVFLKPRTKHIDVIKRIPDSFFVYVDLIDLSKEDIKKCLCAGSSQIINVDSFICRTEENKDILKPIYPDSSFEVIPHYISPSFRVLCENTSQFQPGFFGEMNKYYTAGREVKRYLKEHQYNIPNKPVRYEGSCPIGPGLSDCNFHMNLRDSRHKPSNKIIQAAYSGSNILCSHSAGGVMELLGDSYPYLCEDNVESAKQVMAKAKSDFGGARWQYGLDIMRSILVSHGDSSIIDGYSRLVPR